MSSHESAGAGQERVMSQQGRARESQESTGAAQESSHESAGAAQQRELRGIEEPNSRRH